jgi:predicted LPLAT superfamily acyltransferase
MDFDTAIIVRLFWAGVPVINLPTRVTYPKDGVSNFHVLKDNVRISRTHTLLIIGMILRSPILLGRKIKRWFVRDKHWSRMAERGTLLGLKTVSWTYRLLGRQVALILLWPVTAYFFVTGRTARNASLKYLRKIYETFGSHEDLPREPNFRDSFRHFYAFSKSGLDKFTAWFGKNDSLEVVFPDREALSSINSTGRGAVFIGAHLGNMEMSRAKGVASGLSGINAVVFTDHAVRFTSILKSVNPKFDLNLIQVSSLGPDTAILLQEKIDRGEMLFIMGDRTPPQESGRISTVPFLGSLASFPQGPYILSHLLACPVYLFFCIKEGNIYKIHFEPFAEQIKLPRRGREEQIQTHAAKYAKRLEYYCGRSPLQWFNFFDFWRQEPCHTDQELIHE